ncbi:MAG: ABC transporter permease [Clostridia bacterium]|nr:ABC transporter permease [Clostridia bacterium]
MTKLTKKMIRDIKLNLSQFITIFLMVMIGVMAYSGIEAYMNGMINAADKFYSENNLQDLNIMGIGFSKENLDKIKDINNVKNAERKLVLNAINSYDNDKGYLISFIESNEISKFYVSEGEEFDVNKSGVWLDKFYADENNLHVGDKIKFKYDSLELEEKILGTIQVPDHLYDVKDESELLPNREIYGFAYVSVNEIPESYIKSEVMKNMNIEDETIFDMYVKDFNYKEYIPYNYIMVDVDNTEEISQVKKEIEDTIENALAIINIEDTPSYQMYQGEIDEGKAYVGVFSGLFLFIAVLSVITTMTRVINKQRIQIGTLKALGFKDFRVLTHYVGYGFWVSLLGALCGLIAGRFFIGEVFLGMEMDYFEVPNGVPIITIQSYIVAGLVTLGISLVTYLTCRKQLRENPAETLRLELPKVKSNSLNITTKGFFKETGFSTKWNIRDIVRNKIRTITGIAGITGCCLLIVCALGMLNSMNYFIELQFEDLYNFNYKLSLKEDISDEDTKELEDKYGANTSKTLGIEIKDKDGNRNSNNIFVYDANEYVRFHDDKDNYINIDNDGGIYVTYKLAETKGYKLGDIINWHIYGDNNYYESEIVGFNRDPQNQNVTMTRNYLESLGIEYKPDTIYTNLDLSNNKDIQNVESVQDINTLKDSISEMLSMMKSMIIIIIGVAVVLGVVIIYNMGVLSYSEKQYQFATLKVLGFTDKKIKSIFIKQNNWIAIISIILGLPGGNYLTDWLFKAAIDEQYDFGTHINVETYIIAAIGTYLVSYLVSKILSKKIEKIDMVSSLKSNE